MRRVLIKLSILSGIRDLFKLDKGGEGDTLEDLQFNSKTKLHVEANGLRRVYLCLGVH